MAALYAFAEAASEHNVVTPHESSTESLTQPSPAAVAKAVANPIAERLMERLNKTSKRIELRVNKVGFDVPIIDVQITENSICCLVKDNGWNCKIPPTRDVQLIVDDVEYPVVFLGSWHRFEWLGVHILFFPKLDEEEASG